MDIDRFCLYCNERIIGRSDKKYCSDQCRSTHHNILFREEMKFMRGINTVLRNNRKILADFRAKGMDVINERRLLVSGFNLNYYTNIIENQKCNKTIIVVYDYGYQYDENEIIRLLDPKELEIY